MFPLNTPAKETRDIAVQTDISEKKNDCDYIHRVVNESFDALQNDFLDLFDEIENLEARLISAEKTIVSLQQKPKTKVESFALQRTLSSFKKEELITLFADVPLHRFNSINHRLIDRLKEGKVFATLQLITLQKDLAAGSIKSDAEHKQYFERVFMALVQRIVDLDGGERFLFNQIFMGVKERNIHRAESGQSNVGPTEVYLQLNDWKEKRDADLIVNKIKEKQGDIRSLNLSDLNLSTFLSDFAKIETVTELDVSHNHIYYFPQSFALPHHLTQLKIERNGLQEIFPCILQLPSLQRLFLEENKISTIPKEITQLQKLEVLLLGRNEIKQVIPEIGQLKNLEVLTLNNNGLSSVPLEIGNLTKLVELHLECNNLTGQIPSVIGALTNLQHLALDNNGFSSVFEAIGNLQELQQLHLQNNRFTTLPESITKLTSLSTLHLEGNPLKMLSKKIKNMSNVRL